ncbi:MAG: adenosine deaminase [Chloroflexi bacterium]|nr:adenosine deaminase [Chloroflexota bacterium]
MSLIDYITAAPKAELHLHLEGAIRPATILELAERNGVNLPAITLAELSEWFIFRDFKTFVTVYGTLSNCLITTDDFELITVQLAEELVSQNVKYAEVTFTPSTHYNRGICQKVFFDGLTRGREKARKMGLEINWVFDISRGIEDAEMRNALADYTVGVALEGKEEGVIALGLGGQEAGFPPQLFQHQFSRGIAGGLHSTPHAGEVVGPASVWDALNYLQAERIGHGVRSIEDPQLVAYLAERQIPLEINPTSNLLLGIYPDLDQHPLPHLMAAGVPVSVNSDDPALFGTTLTRELTLLSGEFGFDLESIDQILLNPIRHSFLDKARKESLEKMFLTSLQGLKQKYLTN